MQGGKNWISSKEINQTSSSETLIGLKSGKHSFPSIGPNGGTVAIHSGLKHGGRELLYVVINVFNMKK
jgi:hypothetical protein